MFDLVIILTRYLFIFYIIYFLWQGIRYIASERGIWNLNKKIAVSKQRVTIVFFHITAFLILSYIPNTYAFNSMTLLIGGAGLALFFAMQVGIDKIYKGSCPLIWNGMFFLMDTGLIMLVRLGFLPKGAGLAEKQLIWYFAGFCAVFFIPAILKIIPRFEKLEIVYLILGIGLLSATFILGKEEYGALLSIRIGSISLQPSEAVKFIFIFYLAAVFRKKLEFKQIIFPTAMAVAFVVILVLQRELGGALIYFMTFMVMMYASTGSDFLFVSGMAAASAASVLAYHVFSHVRVRVAIWQDPWADVYNTGLQIVQSLFAIGTWGPLGIGLTRGYPGYIPVVERDMIFAAICEELSPIFGMGIIGVYIMIFYRGVHIALRCKRRYYSLLAVGFTAMMAFQTFLIIGGTIKLIPLTGVTLPFISYGGSSVLISTMMIGILQWLYMYYREDKGKEDTEDYSEQTL